MLIRVSNVDRSTTVDDIWDLFAEFGEVEEAEINDFPDPEKDTFTAYVEMPYVSEAEEAIAELNGERVDGRILSVKVTEKKEEVKSLSYEESDLEEEEF